MVPMTFRMTRRTARPMVALARQPGPNRLSSQLISSRRAMGPLTMTRGPAPPVDVAGPAKPAQVKGKGPAGSQVIPNVLRKAQ